MLLSLEKYPETWYNCSDWPIQRILTCYCYLHANVLITCINCNVSGSRYPVSTGLGDPSNHPNCTITVNLCNGPGNPSLRLLLKNKLVNCSMLHCLLFDLSDQWQPCFLNVNLVGGGGVRRVPLCTIIPLLQPRLCVCFQQFRSAAEEMLPPSTKGMLWGLLMWADDYGISIHLVGNWLAWRDPASRFPTPGIRSI